MSDENVPAGLREVADRLAADYDGTLGVAATVLTTGESVFLNADAVMPTASVIKMAIVSELFTQAAEGRLDPAQSVTVTAEAHVGGSGVLATLSPGLTLPLSDLAMLTISVSDNTASNLCLAAVGGPAVVNRRMREEWGMAATTIHRPIKFALTPDDPPHTATGSPRDFLRLLTLLAQGRIHDRAASDEVLRRMAEVHDSEMLPRYLTVNPYASDLRTETPPFEVQHKTGKQNGVRCDAALIRRGDDTLAVCVFTRGVKDGRWTPANAGEEAVAQIGKLLCDQLFD